MGIEQQSTVVATVEPTVDELRLLSPSAWRLWAALVRERDRQATPDGWFMMDLAELARRGRMSYSTASRVLGDLRRTGLGSTERHIVRRRIAYRKTVNAKTYNWIYVHGSIGRRGAYVFPIWWKTFVDLSRACGRRGLVRMPVMAPKMVAVDERCFQGLRSEAQKLVAQPGDSGYKKRESRKERSRSRDATASDTSSDPASVTEANEGDEDLLAMIDRPRPDLGWVRKPGPSPWLPPDAALPVQQPTFQTIDVGLNEVQRATFVVEGLRRAIAKVYGTKWYGWTRGDIRQAKQYPKIKAAAEAMLDGGMVPEHWCEWRLRYFKDKAKAFAHKPPPPLLVLAASSIKKMSGFFRKDFERPFVTYKLDELRAEQMLRNREAARRHEGRPSIKSIFLGLPRWYYEMRIVEIALGHEDPHVFWPTRRKVV